MEEVYLFNYGEETVHKAELKKITPKGWKNVLFQGRIVVFKQDSSSEGYSIISKTQFDAALPRSNQVKALSRLNHELRSAYHLVNKGVTKEEINKFIEKISYLAGFL